MKSRRGIGICLVAVLSVCVIFCVTIYASAETKKSSEVYLQRFENFYDMYNCSFDNFFGKIDLDDTWKTEGNTSAKIEVQTLTNELIAPKVYILAQDAGYGYDLSDLSMIDFLSFSLKNGNDFVSKMRFDAVNENNVSIFSYNFQLDAGESASYSLKMDRQYLATLNETICGYTFTFDISPGTWYLDNIYAQTAAKEIDAPEKDFNGEELFDFEDSSDKNFFYINGTYRSTLFDTALSIVTDGISGKDQALKISFLPELDISSDENVQPAERLLGVSLAKVFLDEFDFNRLKTETLSFDAYVVSDRTETLVIYLADTSGRIFKKEFEVKPLRWQTIQLPTDEISKSAIDFEKITEFSVYIESFLLNGDTYIYLDNFTVKGL